jgi:hypothetical protein
MKIEFIFSGFGLISTTYIIIATKDGNVCDDDGVEAGVQRSGLVYFLTLRRSHRCPNYQILSA